MLVGTKEIDPTTLRKACRTKASLEEFTLSLIPSPLRHLPEVMGNQKYLVALHVRRLQSLSWAKRKELCEGLLQDVRIKGVASVFYDYQDLLLEIDPVKFSRYWSEHQNAT